MFTNAFRFFDGRSDSAISFRLILSDHREQEEMRVREIQLPSVLQDLVEQSRAVLLCAYRKCKNELAKTWQ